MAGRIVVDEPPAPRHWDRFVARVRRRRAARAARQAPARPRASSTPDFSHVGPGRRRGRRATTFRARVGRGTAPLKARLLDQGVIAGVGNLLADETLWRARLSPRRPAGDAVERRSSTGCGAQLRAATRVGDPAGRRPHRRRDPASGAATGTARAAGRRWSARRRRADDVLVPGVPARPLAPGLELRALRGLGRSARNVDLWRRSRRGSTLWARTADNVEFPRLRRGISTFCAPHRPPLNARRSRTRRRVLLRLGLLHRGPHGDRRLVVATSRSRAAGRPPSSGPGRRSPRPTGCRSRSSTSVATPGGAQRRLADRLGAAPGRRARRASARTAAASSRSGVGDLRRDVLVEVDRPPRAAREHADVADRQVDLRRGVGVDVDRARASAAAAAPAARSRGRRRARPRARAPGRRSPRPRCRAPPARPRGRASRSAAATSSSTPASSASTGAGRLADHPGRVDGQDERADGQRDAAADQRVDGPREARSRRPAAAAWPRARPRPRPAGRTSDPEPSSSATDIASATTTASCHQPVPSSITSRSATAMPSVTPEHHLDRAPPALAPG